MDANTHITPVQDQLGNAWSALYCCRNLRPIQRWLQRSKYEVTRVGRTWTLWSNGAVLVQAKGRAALAAAVFERLD